MKTDRLHEIFRDLLLSSDDPNETAASLIRRVASIYAFELLARAAVPLHLVDDMMTDLEAEVLEMYRKTTYGHLTLESFRTSRRNTKRT